MANIHKRESRGGERPSITLVSLREEVRPSITSKGGRREKKTVGLEEAEK